MAGFESGAFGGGCGKKSGRSHRKATGRGVFGKEYNCWDTHWERVDDLTASYLNSGMRG